MRNHGRAGAEEGSWYPAHPLSKRTRLQAGWEGVLPESLGAFKVGTRAVAPAHQFTAPLPPSPSEVTNPHPIAHAHYLIPSPNYGGRPIIG